MSLSQALVIIRRSGGRFVAVVTSVLKGIFTLVVVLCIIAAQQLVPLDRPAPVPGVGARRPRYLFVRPPAPHSAHFVEQRLHSPGSGTSWSASRAWRIRHGCRTRSRSW